MTATLTACGLLAEKRECHCASATECGMRDHPEFLEKRLDRVEQMEKEKQAAHGYGPDGYAAIIQEVHQVMAHIVCDLVEQSLIFEHGLA